MKKLIIFSIVLILSTDIFAFDMVDINSQQWQAVNTLCIANGVLPPSSVSPLPVSELIEALARIPASRLDLKEIELMNQILSSLEEESLLNGKYVSIDPKLIIAPEVYFQTDPVESQFDYAYDIKDMMSFLTLGADFHLGNNTLAYADYIFLSPGLTNQASKHFGFNIDDLLEFQHEGIFKAGIVGGNDFLYGGIFRSRQSMGYGKTGNLMVGDNFSRQDFLRFHFSSEWFDYTLNLTHFDQSKATDSPSFVEIEKNKFNGMHQIQGIHRFEGKFLDKIRVVFQEGMMLNSSSAFDFRLLNPFIYFHGLYNFSEAQDYTPGETHDEANNYTALELSFVPVSHISFNIQFLMDQIQIGGERVGSDVCPQAFGLLANIESPWIIDKHWINFWFESVAIMPYTYLNLKRINNTEYDTNLDMITGYHNTNQDEIGYAGYKYGGDSLVNSLGVDFGIFDFYELSGSFTYMIHGKYGYGYQTIIPERGEEHLNDGLFTGVGIKNAEHRLIFSLDSTIFALDGLDFSFGLSYLQIFNHGCIEGKTTSDLQFKVGFSFSPIDMFT